MSSTPWMAKLRATYGDAVADAAKATADALPPLSSDQASKLRALLTTAAPPTGRKSA
jgi:hypothetical protein